ncbi:MAG TPA: hypothetical protein VLL05_18295 [Terriglobales bacterium]|nr:hypothetical protein [Terriglobales bacterium]
MWRLTVKSRQGEPFAATATLQALPDEHISEACLSLGSESDAAGKKVPLLTKARLQFDAANGTVDISTDEPVKVPALSLVLRVQCPGSPLYVRRFSALIPPAVEAQGRIPAVERDMSKGFHLALLPGDTLESIAAVLFPASKELQRALVKEVVAGNPQVYVNGPHTAVKAGTVVWFPDLGELRNASRGKSGQAVQRRSAPASREAALPKVAQDIPPEPRQQVTLQRALELGDKPGPRECTQLMQLCAAQGTVPAVPPALEDKAQVLQSGINQVHLKQESIDAQLQRIEQSLQALQANINSALVQPPAPAPTAPPPKVEVRTVVKSEPVPWYVWAGLAGLVIVAALGGFAYGRRGPQSSEPVQAGAELDRMLATAATEMRDLESAAEPAEISEPVSRRPPARPPSPAAVSAPAPEPEESSLRVPAEDVPPTDVPRADINLNLQSEPVTPPQVAGLSTDVLYEMDQALDNTRSMFTDVDRFIALGRTQNALSLLQFQVHKDPKDRDSWIKLLAIYRQEKMDAELARAIREFHSNFPNENPPAV